MNRLFPDLRESDLTVTAAVQTSTGPERPASGFLPARARRVLQCLVGNFVGEDFLVSLVAVADVVVHEIDPFRKTSPDGRSYL